MIPRAGERRSPSNIDNASLVEIQAFLEASEPCD